MSLWTIIFLFLYIFPCGTRPATNYTIEDSDKYTCIDLYTMQTAGSISSWLLDLAILIEPIVMVSTLA